MIIAGNALDQCMVHIAVSLYYASFLIQHVTRFQAMYPTLIIILVYKQKSVADAMATMPSFVAAAPESNATATHACMPQRHSTSSHRATESIVIHIGSDAEMDNVDAEDLESVREGKEGPQN